MERYVLSSYCTNSHNCYSFGRVHINRYLRWYIRSTYIRLDNSSRAMFLLKQGHESISADNSELGQEKHLVSARELNIYWSTFFASPIERNWFQRPRLVKPRSRSSASESCEAMATSELDDMLSILSREDILAILAFGDMEEALKAKAKSNIKTLNMYTPAWQPAFLKVSWITSAYLAKPFFPLGGLSPFEANSSTCFRRDNSSASAARLHWTN